MTTADGGQHDIETRVHCPECGYNLRGLPDGKCPECGTPFERDTLVRLDQPTVSMGGVRLFAVIWPVLYLLLIAPIVGLVVLAIRFGLEMLMGTQFNAWFVPGVLYAVLTFAMCWPVCRDMARQAARCKRLMDETGEHVSERLWFCVYMMIEFGVIIMVTLGVLWLVDGF